MTNESVQQAEKLNLSSLFEMDKKNQRYNNNQLEKIEPINNISYYKYYCFYSVQMEIEIKMCNLRHEND